LVTISRQYSGNDLGVFVMNSDAVFAHVAFTIIPLGDLLDNGLSAIGTKVHEILRKRR
jgi:hypothetical protein